MELLWLGDFLGLYDQSRFTACRMSVAFPPSSSASILAAFGHEAGLYRAEYTISMIFSYVARPGPSDTVKPGIGRFRRRSNSMSIRCVRVSIVVLCGPAKAHRDGPALKHSPKKTCSQALVTLSRLVDPHPHGCQPSLAYSMPSMAIRPTRFGNIWV